MEVNTPRKRRTRRPSFAKLLKAHNEKALLKYCEMNDQSARIKSAHEAAQLIGEAQLCKDELDAIQLCLQALEIYPMATDALLGLVQWCTYTEEEAAELRHLATMAASMEQGLDKTKDDGLVAVENQSINTLDASDVSHGHTQSTTEKSALASEFEQEALSQEYQAVEDKLAIYSEPETGILTVSGLDGLFAALVSSPILLTGEQWMPLLFSDGSKAPQWESTEEFMSFFNGMTIVLNHAADTLQDTPEKYIPLTRKSNQFKNPTAQSIQDWCRGYLKIIGFWNLTDQDEVVHSALVKIQHFANPANFEQLADLNLAEQVQLFLDLSASSYAIYTYFEVPRNAELELVENAEKAKQPIRKEVEIGRNEACPCGSGKKYKRCCLS